MGTTPKVIFGVGIAAALLLAVGFVVQHHAAREAPSEERLSPRLLLDLVRRPLWLAGIAAMVAGQVLGAVALATGQLTLVEPLLASNVLFALPLAAAWSRRRLCRRDWAGAVILIAGLATFVAAAGPGAETGLHVSHLNWVIAGGAIVAFVCAVVAVAKRSEVAKEATLLAVGAGTLYGLQDALTQRTLQMPLTPATLATAWSAYALVAVAIVGMLLTQSAYQAAPLQASQPALAVCEPVTGIALGAGLFGQGLRLTPVSLTFEMLGIAAMIAGLVIVSRSPVVTGAAAPEAGSGPKSPRQVPATRSRGRSLQCSPISSLYWRRSPTQRLRPSSARQTSPSPTRRPSPPS